MNKRINDLISEKNLPFNFACFYGVGIVLFMLPFTRPVFISITAISLLSVFSIVFYYHKQWSWKVIGWFGFIFLSSFFLEMQGVSSGKVFGAYVYGRALGWKINGTPVIIGLNWLFLTYASHDIVRKELNSPVLRVVAGSLLMVLYDWIVEQVAPSMDMWRFNLSTPPFLNYFTWFGAACIYHTGFEVLKITSDNYPARSLFWIQILFFIILYIGVSIFSL